MLMTLVMSQKYILILKYLHFPPLIANNVLFSGVIDEIFSGKSYYQFCLNIAGAPYVEIYQFANWNVSFSDESVETFIDNFNTSLPFRCCLPKKFYIVL